MKKAVDNVQLSKAYTLVQENMMGGMPVAVISTGEQESDCGSCGMCGSCQSHPEEDHRDSSEMEMAQSDIHKALEYSQKLAEMLPNITSLEGWTASKITKASDYLSSVYHWLSYESSYGDGSHHPEHDHGHGHETSRYNMGSEDGECM